MPVPGRPPPVAGADDVLGAHPALDPDAGSASVGAPGARGPLPARPGRGRPATCMTASSCGEHSSRME